MRASASRTANYHVDRPPSDKLVLASDVLASGWPSIPANACPANHSRLVRPERTQVTFGSPSVTIGNAGSSPSLLIAINPLKSRLVGFAGYPTGNASLANNYSKHQIDYTSSEHACLPFVLNHRISPTRKSPCRFRRPPSELALLDGLAAEFADGQLSAKSHPNDHKTKTTKSDIECASPLIHPPPSQSVA